jgi:hypothetical protein
MEMASATKTYELIWTATYEWLEVAEKQGLVCDWDCEPVHSDDYDAAKAVAEQDPEDTEGGFGLLVEPRDCDTLLKSGDIIATSGPGGDVAFLRDTRQQIPEIKGDVGSAGHGLLARLSYPGRRGKRVSHKGSQES